MPAPSSAWWAAWEPGLDGGGWVHVTTPDREQRGCLWVAPREDTAPAIRLLSRRLSGGDTELRGPFYWPLDRSRAG